MFDEGRTVAGAGALRRPSRGGVHRKEIVPIDAQAGETQTRTACRERTLFAAGKALEGGDRPLVVDDVEHHRRAIDLGEQHRVMEIGFRRAALADPRRGDVLFALDRRRHRPADRLRVLRRKIAGDREQTTRRIVVHHGQLPALAHVAGVGEQLAHEIEHRGTATDEEPLVAVGREQHIAGTQRMRRGDRDRLLTPRAHIEADATLTLRTLHAIIEDPRQQHLAQTGAQRVRRQLRVPRPDRGAVVVEDADEIFSERHGLADRDADRRTRHRAGRRDPYITKIRVLARPGGDCGHMQAGRLHGDSLTAPPKRHRRCHLRDTGGGIGRRPDLLRLVAVRTAQDDAAVLRAALGGLVVGHRLALAEAGRGHARLRDALGDQVLADRRSATL